MSYPDDNPDDQKSADRGTAIQAKFQRDWQEVCAKLERLKKLDPCFLCEGADYHQYNFAPPASKTEIEIVEKRLGSSLPAELVYFYTTIGNGRVGPYGGLRSVETLVLFDVAEDEKEDDDDDDDDGYSRSERLDGEHRPDLESALVEVAGREWEFYTFGTEQVLVSCGGPSDGSVSVFVEVSGDSCFFYPFCDSLAEFYQLWIDHELAMFEVARKLVLASDELWELWKRRDEILETEQKNWTHELLDFRERVCSTTGWLHFNTSDDFLHWIGCVLGERLTPDPYTNRPDFGEQKLLARFRAARKRYLESQVEESSTLAT